MSSKKIIVIDEIGLMQMLSASFQKIVQDIVSDNRIVLGTISSDSYPEIDKFKYVKEVKIIGLNELNRDAITEFLAREILKALDTQVFSKKALTYYLGRLFLMTDKVFWELISNSRKQGGKQVEWLIVELSKKPVNEIIDFEIELANKLQQSYTSSLWGAAFVIMGGCSDDGFDYFRGWLIAQGEEVFTKAIKNPEFLADCLTDDYLEEDKFAPQLEEMLSVASDAYIYQKTGEFEYNDEISTEFWDELEARGHESMPAEIEIDWEEDDLEERYPRLRERFSENPLT